MSRPNLITDFKKNIPASPYIIRPFEDSLPKDDETKAAREQLIDQVFGAESVSIDIVNETRFVVLLRPLEYLPTVDDKKNVHGFDWFVGHYDWKSLLTKLLEYSSSNDSGVSYAIYLVPTLGQSLQGSKRHDLTYNAFITPSNEPPFTQLIQRLPTPELKPDEDLELHQKSDPIVFRTLESLDLEWKKITTFTKEKFEMLDSLSVDVFVFSPTRRMMTQINKLTDQEFESWYDVVIGNFLPVIPNPTNADGTLQTVPLIIIDPIECTPPHYKDLVTAVQSVNAAIGGEVSAIPNLIKYWQFAPLQIADAITIFINNDGIPQKSPEFNNLFVEQFIVAREFIVDEIFSSLLKIKRTDEDEPPSTWKGSQAEIDWELDFFDARAKKLFGSKPEAMTALSKLKELIPFWFDRDCLPVIYGEFKDAITNALKQSITTQAFSSYLKISKEENSRPNRNTWLKSYFNNEVSFCMWPTVYQCSYDEKSNHLLVEMEKELLIHAHLSIPGMKGKILPPK